MSLVTSIVTAAAPTAQSTIAPTSAASSSGSASSFGQTMVNALNDVNQMQLQAGSMAKDFAVGKTSDIHSVMIAAEQATLSLQLATQVRNKVVEAYQQIMQISM